MNPMSELKAKDLKPCPMCGSSAEESDYPDTRYLRCAGDFSKPGKMCDMQLVWIHADQWNTRPRERELEGALSIAKGGFEYLRKVAPRTCRGLVDGNIAAITAVLGKGGE